LEHLIGAFHTAHFSVDALYPLLEQESDAPASTMQYMLISKAHASHVGQPGFRRSKAKALRKLGKCTRHLDLVIDYIDPGTPSSIPAHLSSNISCGLLEARDTRAAGNGPADVVLMKLTDRSFPSEVHLVRSADGRIVVRKTFCAGFGRNLDRELMARQLIDDPRLSPILAASGKSIYMPWHNEYRAFTRGLFKFYPIRAARNVIDFLESLNARGLAMVDINPGSFLYDSEGNIKVVDCEYMTRTPTAISFERSLDFIGARTAGAHEAPRSTGWDHFWRDAVGVPYRVVRFGSPVAVACWRAVQILIRVAASPIALLGNVRQTVLSIVFYWSRKRPWGLRILGDSSRTASLSLPAGPIRRLLHSFKQTTHAMF
jgi:hypothetical protein